MCELLGAALDAAVARVLDLKDIVYRPNGQPAYELPFDPEGPAHEYPHGRKVMYLYFMPSQDGHAAMGLLAAHDMAVYPDKLSDQVGTEKWIAGFNLSVTDKEYRYGSTETGPWTEAGGSLDLDHAGRGDTPAIAICRALVARHDHQVAEAAKEAERQRLLAIAVRAEDRAFYTLQTRQRCTEFESDEDRRAYDARLDRAQRENGMGREVVPRITLETLTSITGKPTL